MKYFTLLPLFILISCGTPEGMIVCTVCDEDYSKKSLECVHCGEPNAVLVETKLKVMEIQAEVDALQKNLQKPEHQIGVYRDQFGQVRKIGE